MVVGLGNPGDNYRNTRHNIGFEIVEHLAEKWNISFSHELRFLSSIASSSGILLVKPQTYMNRSGETVNRLKQYFKLSPASFLVVYDEVALNPGILRIRKTGSAGGHNGMKSLIQHLGTEKFPRMRVGIGEKPSKMDLSHYVLGKFSKSERDILDPVIPKAGEAIETILKIGIDQAMNIYNKKETV